MQEVLDGLFERFEELRPRLADDDGSLRRFVNVYLAGEDIRFLDGLATPVSDGAELTILPASPAAETSAGARRADVPPRRGAPGYPLRLRAPRARQRG